MSRQLYPECGHSRDKGDRHHQCIVCLGREHAEAALSVGIPSCDFCAGMTLAKVAKRLAYWDRRDAGEPSPVHTGQTLPAEQCSPSAAGSGESGSHITAAAAPAAPSPTSPPSLELPHCHSDQPVPDLDSGLQTESLQVFSTRDVSEDDVSEDDTELYMADELRAPSPPVSSRTLGHQLHEVALRAADRLGLPLPAPPITETSLLDGEFYSGPPVSAPSPIPFFPEVHRELMKTWASPYSARAPVPGFASYLNLDQAKESGYLSFPQVEDAVAGYLSPTMRLGQKPLLPTRVARHQAGLAEKSYLAAGQAACSSNTAALLQRYQAKLLTELSSSLGSDNELVVELRRATDLSLRLTRCTSQALGRVMGAAVATQRSLWLSEAQLSDREKAPLLDAPVSTTGVFGDVVGTMTAKFGERRAPSGPAPTAGKKRSGFRSPAPPAKFQARRGRKRHPFQPPTQPQPQHAVAHPPQSVPYAPRQHDARRGQGLDRFQRTHPPQHPYTHIYPSSVMGYPHTR
ncbi:uncharacterized protein LOC105912761 [Clupea harengus]|uniref:Uncharacterized protein LOC105912761 n=1 Tax=Clupea harengus TaxID=7950 RepID=A0A6P3WF33_CLUHA|nr:uncharacterized protein LOC105912761 [Clupea harengus]